MSVVGELDVATAPALREQLYRVIDAGPGRVVVDLAEMDFIDSTGLGVLVGALKRVKEMDGTLELRSLSPSRRRPGVRHHRPQPRVPDRVVPGRSWAVPGRPGRSLRLGARWPSVPWVRWSERSKSGDAHHEHRPVGRPHHRAGRRLEARVTASTATSATRPPTGSPRSRSAGPRCATRSGRRRCSSSRTRSSGPANDPEVGVIVLTGEGPDAFCSGGDQRVRGDDGYVGDDGIGRLNVLDLQVQIRRLPKPVVAMVAGYAIGGGHVLHVVCDLTIAADNARFGQTGPKVGSLRRRLRLGPARAHRRAEEGTRDLVPVRAVRRARPRSTWASSTRSCRSRELEVETVAVVPQDARALAARAAHAEGVDERGRRRPRRHPAARRRRDAPLLHERGGAGGQATRTSRSAAPSSTSFPKRPVTPSPRRIACTDAPSRVARRGRGRETLGAAVAPVVVGTAAASVGRGRDLVARARPRSCVALALQVGVNYANDYSDGVRGTDADRARAAAPRPRPGSRRPTAVRNAALLAFVVAAVVGLALVARRSNPWLLARRRGCDRRGRALHGRSDARTATRASARSRCSCSSGSSPPRARRTCSSSAVPAAAWWGALAVGLLACGDPARQQHPRRADRSPSPESARSRCGSARRRARRLFAALRRSASFLAVVRDQRASSPGRSSACSRSRSRSTRAPRAHPVGSAVARAAHSSATARLELVARAARSRSASRSRDDRAPPAPDRRPHGHGCSKDPSDGASARRSRAIRAIGDAAAPGCDGGRRATDGRRARRTSVPVNALVDASPVDVGGGSRGFPCVKVKVGRPDPDVDLEVVERCAHAVGDRVALRRRRQRRVDVDTAVAVITRARPLRPRARRAAGCVDRGACRGATAGRRPDRGRRVRPVGRRRAPARTRSTPPTRWC